MKLATEVRWQDRVFKIPVERVRQSEHWGYDAVFTAEASGSDALTPLGYLAAITNRIKLGSCIIQVTTRPPAVAAQAFQTIDHMAGGDRIMIGLGSSAPYSAEAWAGQAWGNPVHRMRDYVAIMRAVASGEPVSHQGKHFTLPYDGPGATNAAPMRAALRTNPDAPIHIGAMGPDMIRLAAEIGDGWMPTGFSPGMLPHFAPLLEAGFARAGNGKGFGNFDIWVHVDVMVDDDVRAAMLPFKQYVATYLQYQAPLMAGLGFADAAARAAELIAAGRRAEAVEAIPDEFIDNGWLCGPLPRLVERLQPWLSSGATGLIVRYGPQVGLEQGEPENLEAFRVIAQALDKPGSR